MDLQAAFEAEPPELSNLAINFQHVFLRRIFSLTLDQGGRFYGGWWQYIKSEYRSRIFINEWKTTECDFSSLGVRMLYAIEGVDPGMGDLYDLGLIYKNDPAESRKKVKTFVTAVLNDKDQIFRLSKSDLNFIGTSHNKLFAALNERHSAISHYFYSGIGLKLQYFDSKIAEDVMMHFLKRGELCLPVHDSFIVRQGLELELEDVMLKSFKKHLKGLAKVDKESGYLDHTLGEVKDFPDSTALIAVLSQHFDAFSIGLSFFRSWEQTNFTPEELIARETKWSTHQSID